MIRLLLTLAVALAATSAAAQQLTLEIQDGRVNLDAASVPAQQILAEWARVGGTRVVGADKIPGGPLTLRLVDVPERQALDIVLRSAAGFMAAPRQASAAPGASIYDRILVLATTTAPAPAPAATRSSTGPAAGPGGRRLPPRPPNLPPAPADAADEEPAMVAEEPDGADTGIAQPVFTFPAPPGAVNGNPTFVPIPGNPQAGNPTPVITLQPNPNGQPAIYNFVPNMNVAPAPAPTQPSFTVIGAQTPGMVQQPAPPAPGQPQRPPPQ